MMWKKPISPSFSPKRKIDDLGAKKTLKKQLTGGFPNVDDKYYTQIEETHLSNTFSIAAFSPFEFGVKFWFFSKKFILKGELTVSSRNSKIWIQILTFFGTKFKCSIFLTTAKIFGSDFQHLFIIKLPNYPRNFS